MGEGTEPRISVVSPPLFLLKLDWPAAALQTFTNRDAKTCTGESIWQGSEQMLQPQGHGAWKPDWHLSIAVLNLLHCLNRICWSHCNLRMIRNGLVYICDQRRSRMFRIPLAGNEELSYKPQRIRAGTKQKFVVGLMLAVLSGRTWSLWRSGDSLINGCFHILTACFVCWVENCANFSSTIFVT